VLAQIAGDSGQRALHYVALAYWTLRCVIT
jgi:hypothetical protein